MFEGIYFANPDYLWLLLLLPGMIFWHIVTFRKTQAELKMPTLSSFQQHSSFWSFVRPLLFVIRILAMDLDYFGHSTSTNCRCFYKNKNK